MQPISSRDHLGNTFKSLAAMCRFWKKDPRIVWYRFEAGKTIWGVLLSHRKKWPEHGESVSIRFESELSWGGLWKMLSPESLS